MAIADEKSQTELFDTFVGNIAGHAASLRVQVGKIRMSAVPGMPMVEFYVKRVEKPWDVDNHVWDQCCQVHEDGTREHLGNRCAMISRYAQICAKALREWAGVEESDGEKAA